MPGSRSIISQVLGYTVSGVAGLFGIGVLAGWFNAAALPSNFRITFAVVLLLLSVYRGVMTWTRGRRMEDDDDDI